MKSVLCVCLFLCSFYSLQISNQSIFHSIENQNITSSEKSLSYLKLSKELNEKELKYKALDYQYRDTLKWNEEQIEQLKKEYEQIKLFLLYNQMHEDQIEIDMGILEQYDHLLKCNEKYKEKIECIQNHIIEIEDTLKQIQWKQEELFLKDSNLEFSDEGKYDPSKMIQGIQSLPPYGSYIDQFGDSYQACLNGNPEIDVTSDSFSKPILNGYISAGTWAYPNGKMHLGMDVACEMYTKIYAPGNGIILYADAPEKDNSGYLGNGSGWPYGGGNTLCMIVSVQNRLYGISFCHLSSQIYVVAGQQVKQNDVLALSGNSGNSSGPHCHIEVFELNCSLEQAISYFLKGADFSFGTGWNQIATCSDYACRIRPESIWG